MNGRRILSLAICIVLGLFASAALYVLAGNAADTSSLSRHVAMTGLDLGDCTSIARPCRTVQYAVDVAGDEDVIKVAAGVYAGVNSYGGLAQVVYLSKTLTVRGGYTTTDWTSADPVANPTTLDAEGQGRVLYITGPIAPTIEGLRMTGGDAAGRGGGDGGTDGGGGVFVTEAAPTIRDCVVYSNTASSTGEGRGGGLYLHDSAAVLSENTIAGNTASIADSGRGGGLYLDGSDEATLSDNLVEGNIASTAYAGSGGGLYLLRSDATLYGNTILDNVGSTAYSGSGGGLHIYLSAATVTGNRVLSNTASTVEVGYGGGLVLSVSPATLTGNVVRGNKASLASQGHGGGLDLAASAATLNDNTIAGNVASTGLAYGGSGGGLTIRQDSAVIMNRNVVEGNKAGTVQRGLGGGLFVEKSEVTLNSNQLITNTATLSPSATGAGGGLYAAGGTSFTLINNVVAGNQANTQGDGILLSGTSDDPTSGRLLHTTIADNFGSGKGVSVPSFATLAFTNTIVASHPGYGIWAGQSTTVTLQATLWYDNGTDQYSQGTFVPGTVNVYGDPAFVDPTTGDYHILSDSAAIDVGVDAGVPVDMDGQSRPYGLGYDIGADEYVRTWQIHLPLVLRGGG